MRQAEPAVYAFSSRTAGLHGSCDRANALEPRSEKKKRSHPAAESGNGAVSKTPNARRNAGREVVRQQEKNILRQWASAGSSANHGARKKNRRQ